MESRKEHSIYRRGTLTGSVHCSSPFPVCAHCVSMCTCVHLSFQVHEHWCGCLCLFTFVHAHVHLEFWAESIPRCEIYWKLIFLGVDTACWYSSFLAFSVFPHQNFWSPWCEHEPFLIFHFHPQSTPTLPTLSPLGSALESRSSGLVLLTWASCSSIMPMLQHHGHHAPG